MTRSDTRSMPENATNTAVSDHETLCAEGNLARWMIAIRVAYIPSYTSCVDSYRHCLHRKLAIFEG